MHKNKLGYSVLSPESLESFMGKIPEHEPLNDDELRTLRTFLDWQGVPLGDKEAKGEYSGPVWCPPLMGNTIEDHFEAMAKELLQPWKPAILESAFGELFKGFKPKASTLDESLGIEDTLSKLGIGWNRISKGKITQEEEILEDWAVIDTETFVKGSKEAHPIIGTAINDKAIYIWIHPQLLSVESARRPYVPMLISAGKGKVLIAHNSAYDFSRVEESFTTEPLSPETGNAWLCTMSMHQLSSGIDSSQRWAFNKRYLHAGLHKRSDIYTEDQIHCEYTLSGRDDFEEFANEEVYYRGDSKPKWMSHGSPKSLVAAYNFHCGGRLEQADKAIRDCFVKYDLMEEFVAILADLLRYAVSDVWYTHKLFQALFPKYLKAAPSSVVLASHIYLSTSAIPVDNEWYGWISRVDNKVKELNQEAIKILEYFTDEVEKIPLSERQSDFYYSQLPDKLVAPDSTKKKACHYIMRLTWKDQPVKEIKGYGFCYTDFNGSIVSDGIKWSRIPHKEGSGNVGNLFSWHYNTFARNGTLKSLVDQDKFLRLMEIQYLVAYWVSTGDRVKQKFIRNDSKGNKVMALNCVPHNTVSNRTGESLWLTVAAHNGEKCGSEIRGKLKAHDDDDIVAFDFSSQELQILSAYSASYKGISGATPFDYSNLVGNKKDKTDIHSLVATKANASRTAAKPSVYGICYGAGKRTVANTFMQHHPELDSKAVTKVAGDTLAQFKGTKQPNGFFMGGIASDTFNKMMEMLNEPIPQTPQLGTRMQPATIPENYGKKGAPSQINWLCQSAGSSMLHCQIVAQEWLIKRLKLDASFLMSVHDG